MSRSSLSLPSLPALLVFLTFPALVTMAQDQSGNVEIETHFELKVRPVLAGACLKCHGPEKASGGLRLDTREAMLEGGESGPAIAPGEPEASLLVQAIRYEHDLFAMPPDRELSPEVVADLADWIAAGAVWPSESDTDSTLQGERHWAFEAIQTIDPPADPTGWAESPIDRLLAVEHRQKGLQPVSPAAKPTLIRRAYYDLIGLPPSPEQVQAFVQDDRPDAFAKVLEELLAMPQYGERWGRYWLDLARYADTAGDNSDYPIPEGYLYRDYVIDSFNQDKPYDQFLQEQIAGDILARQEPEIAQASYAEKVIATGFLAQSKRFGTHKLEDMHLIIEDTLNTTGQVVLGLSLRCARCHDHKYDPISEEDYYGLYGFFASTQYPFAGSEELRKPSEFAALLPPEQLQPFEEAQAKAIAEQEARVEQVEKESELGRRFGELAMRVEALEAEIQKANGADCENLERDLVEQKAERDEVKKQLDEQVKPERDALQKLLDLPPWGPEVPLAYAVREGTPTDAPVQKGGNPRDEGPVIPRSGLKVLDPEGTLEIPEGTSGRLQLARWLTEQAGSLSARVMVNRIWQHHFGKPIVPTPSDFGLRGAPPSHPELLDWLAQEFIDNGWSIKEMHRRIMLSKTYQLASAHDPENAEIDSGNDWYWRFDRQRLDAEALRDTLLLLGGKLDLSRPGPHPFPPLDKWRFTAHHQFKEEYPSDHRSVYLMVQRLHPHSYLSLFNGPDTSITTATRDASTMPLQALFLRNSPFLHEQAEGFSKSLIEQAADPSQRLDLAYQLAISRSPSDLEKRRALNFLEQYAQSLEAEGVSQDRQEQESWASLARLLLASNELIYTD